MNSLVIPPPPNWYETSILACAPDNTLLYGARNDIVVIHDSPNDQPANIQIISRAHSQKITSTNINKQWGKPNKLLVTVAEDKIIKLWNVETLKRKLAHKEHENHNKVIGATFASDERIISVSEEGVIVVWNTSLNETKLLRDIFGSKVTITCLSTCPHATWLTAFGLMNGLVVVTDLRKDGKVIHKVRGHDKSVLSLSWCPAPVNIFPKDPNNYVGVKTGVKKTDTKVKNGCAKTAEGIQTDNESNKDVISENCDSKDIGSKQSDNENEAGFSCVNSNTTINKPKQKYNKNTLWTGLKHADDDDLSQDYIENDRSHPLLRVYDSGDDDFLKECQDLKSKILETSPPDTSVVEEKPNKQVLKPKRGNKRGKNKQKQGKKSDNIEDKASVKGAELQGDADKDETFAKEIHNGIPLAASTLLTEKVPDSIQDKNTMEEVSSAEDVNEAFSGKVEIKTPTISPTVLTESTCDIGSKTIKEVPLTQDDCEVHSEEMEEKTLSESTVSFDGRSDNKEVLLNRDVKREILKIEPIEEEPRKEFLLASSGREGNIYIWRAGTDGRMQTFLTAPNKPKHYRGAKPNADKIWIILCWATPTMLLSSSKSAELIQWKLPKPKEKGKEYRLIHNDHNSIMFSIAAPIVYLNEYKWLKEIKLNAWTVGHNRLLLNTSLASERTNLACYPTIGKAECFALSPLDPNRLAIGTGDGVIKIWDLSRPHVKNIPMTNFYHKIQSKVTTLAWHPTNELLLAFGTLEGRVFYRETNSKSKSPRLFPIFFNSQIHKIEWGPRNGDKEDIGLFVVAEGKLVVFNTNKSEKEPQELDTPDDTYVYTFAWKPDYSLLLVSTKAGSVITYSTDLQILSTQYLQQKLQQIFWHPEAIQNDPNISKYCYWFAAISNSKDLIVYDFGIKTGSSEDKIVSKYEGHKDIINCVAWSPFKPIELVAARDDGIAQVWNVESNSVLSTYMNPNFEGLLTVIWSPVDSDYIISASKDHTIKIWKISDFPAKNEKEISDLRKAVIKEISSECTSLLPKDEKVQEETVKTKKSNKNNLLPHFYAIKDTSQIVLDLRRLLLWKEGLNTAEIGDGDHNHNILNIFGSGADMLKIMNLNETIHKEKGKFNLQNMVSLFKGDLSTTIKEAIDEKRVNPWVIMMAPMVSPKLWYSACEVYAQQLSVESDSDPLEIATFYLMCHKVQEAIDTLCESAMFREALALAKCRLSANDPVVTTIIEKWAKYSLIVGNFETAAQCNIFLGKYEEAASVLFRRSDVEILKFATELAERSGNEELHKAVLFRYNAYNKENTPEKAGKLPSKVEVFLQNVQTKENFQKIGGEHKVATVQETDSTVQNTANIINQKNMKEITEEKHDSLHENIDVVLRDVCVEKMKEGIEEFKEHDETVLFDVNNVRLDSSSKEKSNEGRITLAKEPEIAGTENSGFLTTEEAKRLLSNSKFELFNKNFEAESVDHNKYSGDK